MKQLKKMLSVLAVLALCLSAVTVTVFADTESFTGTLGNSENFWFHQNYDDEVEDAWIENGGVPGMSLSFPNPAAVALSGTPTQAGSYTLYVSVYTVSGEWLQYTLNITIKEPPQTQPTQPPQPTQPAEPPAVDLRPSLSAVPQVTKNPTGETIVEGESAVFIARADYVNKYVWEIAIGGAVVDAQELPGYIGKGIQVSGANSEKLVLSAIPRELNDAYVRCKFIGAEESVYSEYARITVIPVEKATPRVTKDPTDETIREGDEVVFVAKADYAQKYTWKLVAPDGKETLCQEAEKAFAGLKVSGGDTERITLSHVPAGLDGYRIYCEFTAGSTVAGGKAKLTVIPVPTQAPTEPEPTEKPTEKPTEALTQPTEETRPAEPETTVATEAEETPAPQKSGNGLIITIIISLTVVAVAAIAAVVFLKLKGLL